MHIDSAIKNPLETESETDCDKFSEKVSIVGSP